MKISVELTFTPLMENYEVPIIEFIKTLRASKFKVLENPLSTQIYGEFAELMPFLTQTIERSFEKIEAGLIHIKLVKTDRSGYEPHF